MTINDIARCSYCGGDCHTSYNYKTKEENGVCAMCGSGYSLALERDKNKKVIYSQKEYPISNIKFVLINADQIGKNNIVLDEKKAEEIEGLSLDLIIDVINRKKNVFEEREVYTFTRLIYCEDMSESTIGKDWHELQSIWCVGDKLEVSNDTITTLSPQYKEEERRGYGSIFYKTKDCELTCQYIVKEKISKEDFINLVKSFINDKQYKVSEAWWFNPIDKKCQAIYLIDDFQV